MRKALILFLILLATSVSRKAIAKSFHFNPLYDYETADLVKRLKNAKTDTAKLNLLISLAFCNNALVESPAFIDTARLDELINLNKTAHLFNDQPFQTLKLALRQAKTNYPGELALLKAAINQFDEQGTDIPMLLIATRWIFNVANMQEDKLQFYNEKLSYYLQKGRFDNAAACYHCLAGYYGNKSDFNSAISNYLKAGELFKSFSHLWYMHEFTIAGRSYSEWGNKERALFYIKKALSVRTNTATANDGFGAFAAMAAIEYDLKQYQSSLYYLEQTSPLTSNKVYMPYLRAGEALDLIGLNRLDEARAELDKMSVGISDPGLMRAIQNDDYVDLAFYKYYFAVHDVPKAGFYLLNTYKKDKADLNLEKEVSDLKELAQFYGDQKKTDLAWQYTALYNKLNDSIQSKTNGFKIASYENEQQENEENKKLVLLQQQRAVQEATLSQRNLIIWISLIGLAAVMASLILIYRQLQINRKNLAELKATQTQLIQSEKMASLGELTAGIAHEIQNPLNFVNNFSEVSAELIDEMDEELQKGDTEEARAIGADLKQNLEKIKHHGKRADFIVKGMLEHSRTNTGEKQPTDLNVLCDEFLKLSYHGLRAKDKSFNAEMITHFDPKLPKVRVSQQDMGRVMLNLFNNAFYAVNQKAKTAGADYKPEVSVNTSTENGLVAIKVKDNGIGIPDSIKDKIMQPFFTTKPTGEGTGLGLSLTYEMVVKGHAGNIQVNSVESEGSEFIIQVPFN